MHGGVTGKAGDSLPMSILTSITYYDFPDASARHFEERLTAFGPRPTDAPTLTVRKPFESG